MFGDESGDFSFSNHKSASEYFVVTTVAFFDDRQACHDVDDLRLRLEWEGVQRPDAFHAANDQQAIRDRIFGALVPHAFRVDATILQKRKVQPQIGGSRERFYTYVWHHHLRHVAPRLCQPGDEILIMAASVGNQAERGAFHAGVRAAAAQTLPGIVAKTTHWPAAQSSGLQIADYCGWAIQRKWERADERSHILIRDKIRSETDLFRQSNANYY